MAQEYILLEIPLPANSVEDMQQFRVITKRVGSEVEREYIARVVNRSVQPIGEAVVEVIRLTSFFKAATPEAWDCYMEIRTKTQSEAQEKERLIDKIFDNSKQKLAGESKENPNG